MRKQIEESLRAFSPTETSGKQKFLHLKHSQLIGQRIPHKVMFALITKRKQKHHKTETETPLKQKHLANRGLVRNIPNWLDRVYRTINCPCIHQIPVKKDSDSLKSPMRRPHYIIIYNRNIIHLTSGLKYLPIKIYQSSIYCKFQIFELHQWSTS